MSVEMALAECQHHSTQRQKKARAREEEREVHHTAAFRTTVPPPEPELFDLFEEPCGVRPNLLLEPQGLQERVLQHTVEHADATLLFCADSRCSCSADGEQYPILRYCSELWSSTLTFQFLVVEGDPQVFKVLFPDRVQQLLLSRSFTFLVEVFKVYALDRVQRRLHLTLQLVRMMTRMSLVKGVLALSPGLKKCEALECESAPGRQLIHAAVRLCLGAKMSALRWLTTTVMRGCV